MKKLALIILITFVINVYSQVTESWNPVCTTYVPTIGAENIAMFVNHKGIHFIQLVPPTQGNPTVTIKYFRLKSNGDLDGGITSDGIVVDTYGSFPNLVGDETNIYAIYQRDNKIIIKRYPNEGNYWYPVTSITFSNGYSTSNGVDAVYDENGIHVVWSQKEGTIYNSYYARYYLDQWVYTSEITNHDDLENGGFPTITTSNINGSQKVHFCINTGTGDQVNSNQGQNFSRDYNYSTWADPIQIASINSQVDRLIVTSDGRMHSFYYEYASPAPNFKYQSKMIDENVWGTPVQINISGKTLQVSNVEKIEITKSANDKLHAFWMGYNNPWGFQHSEKTSIANNWSTPFPINGGVNHRELASTSNSNDLYVIFSQNVNIPLRLRQYDANPLTPKNFAGTVYNNNPRLNWSINSEADLSYYEIWRRFILDPKNPYSWSLLTTTTQTSFIDYDVFVGNGSWGDVEYKIRAKDNANHLSGYSNIISFDFQGLQKSGSSSSNEINDYSLDQNYPNPFNPSTKILYSIKEEGLVSLKVYDVLGKEVATLINENKPEGYYEVEFDASQLPSGMYIYSIQVGDFKESKKMLLLK